MESALAWIGKIADWVGQWFPRWVILLPTMGGIKYVRGKPKLCAPGGVHWYWPVTTVWDTYPVARQADDLRTQTLVTTDDKTIVAGGMIIYEVINLMKLLPTTFQASQAVKDIALTVIHSVCCAMSWPELKREQQRGTLDTKLRNEARKVLEEYGVKVLKVQLTDLAPARVLKIMQSTSKDEV